MTIFKYSRKEAINNGCYNKVALKPRTYFVLYCILPIIVLIGLLILLSMSFPESIRQILYFILLLIILIGYPSAAALYFINNNNWFTRVFILDDNKTLWLVEQYNKSYDNIEATNDNTYLKILNKYQNMQKSDKGNAIKLSNLSLQKVTRKYYICNYFDENNISKQIKILKAYENINKILR